MKRLFLILFLVAMGANTLQAQKTDPFESVDVDSLKIALNAAGSETEQRRILEKLLLSVKPGEPSQSFAAYEQRFYTLNKRHTPAEQVPVQLHLASVRAFEQKQYDSCIVLMQRLISWYDERQIPLGLVSPLALIREVYNVTGNTKGRLRFYEEKLDHYLLNGPRESEAVCYHGLAGYYALSGNYNEAISNYLKAAEVYKDISTDDYCNELYCAAAYYYYWGNLDRAQYYYREVLKHKNEPLESIVLAYMDLGFINKEQEHYQAALLFIDSALHHARELRFYEEEPFILLERGSILAKLGKKQEGLAVLKAVERMGDSLNILLYSSAGEFEIDHAFFDYYQAEGNMHRAAGYLHQALNKARLLGHHAFALKYLRELAHFYERFDPSKALSYYSAYTSLCDSVQQMSASGNIAYYESIMKEKAHMSNIEQLKKERDRQTTELSERKKFLVISCAALGLFVILAVTLYMGYKDKTKAHKAIEIERQKSEQLLHNILPSEVAEELKEHGNAAARSFDHVTVIFTDFVGFTKAGERMHAQELVNELHACFKAFDEIISKFGIEKIKTIGDAYMAVCGLPLPDEQHAQKVLDAALEIRQFMNIRKQELKEKTFEVRIGIHSGPVVAGIVGVKKFAYDIWGDTVNTAARMEQSSEAGRINISSSTYSLVQHEYQCVYRGEINAKNKGALGMYFVEGKMVQSSSIANVADR